MSGWRQPDLGREVTGRPVYFTFDGQSVEGLAGDTVASALLAAGHSIVGRSFKYHRPRGLWGLGAEEPNAVFDIALGAERWVNQKGPLVPLRDGMDVRSVNTKGGAARDRLGFIDLFHRFLPAGFYYKTFKAGGWMRYEPHIRAMAGLGRLEPGAPPPLAKQSTVRVEALVVGSGPAGLAAAKALASRGKPVWLIEESHALGGALRWRGGDIEGAPWEDYVAEVKGEIEAAGGRVMTGTTLCGAFDHGMFAAWQRGAPDHLWRLRAADVVLATGAVERPLWAANNDRPGVMSAEAGLHHLALYGAVAGRRVVIAGGSDGLFPVAEAFRDAGASVLLADRREEVAAPEGVRLMTGAQLTGVAGRRAVRGAEIDGRVVPADAVLCSGGFTPSVQIWCQAGGKLDWDAARDALVPRPGTADMGLAGAANGRFGLAAALEEGHRAGGGAGPAPRATGPAMGWDVVRPDPRAKGRIWVDYQNDVTLKDIGLAAREGYTSVEHLKRYTTLGMATDQGRTSNFAGLAAMAAITGRSIPEVGTTTFRPPVRPVPLPVLGGLRRGDLFDPLGRLALEEAHRGAGAQFREYGGWLRPAYYGTAEEAASVQAEALAARQRVALFDGSPLGKLEVIGPAAAELLQFCFCVPMASLKPGRARYGLMLRESGVIYDDGVVLRLSLNRFVVSASSSHVDGVRAMLEDARQDRFARSGVVIHDVTQGWVTLTVTGPRARQVLSQAGIALPELAHMAVTEVQIDGAPARVARISFTGDLSYEISVPGGRAPEFFERLDRARAAADGVWMGSEALMILRAEKGYILIGKDTDGLTLPQDLGDTRPLRRRDEFLGKRSLTTEAAQREDRHQLVGFAVPRDTEKIVTGSHLVPLDGERRSLGYVTTSEDSPGLGRPIALGLLRRGRALVGQEIGCFHNGAVRPVRVVEPCAFDPGGERLA